MANNLNFQIKNAAKWSIITEIAAKLITPISSMVLARLLTPEVFGIVATLTMIISFAELFTDAGFQKYLIQHEFKNDEDRIQSTNVAFWSNFIMSLAIWAIIVFFCEPLAVMVGNPGLGFAIAIACVSIPLASFSSIQIALYKRDFDFKALFKVRIVGILIPIIVTIPLALILKNFWAIVLGNIVKDIVNTVLLTYYSKWKPSLYYSCKKLKEMVSFTFWTMVETLSIWGANYFDVFIVSVYLSTFYLGIYKTSMITVTQISSLITSTLTPVIFSTLSRLQNDKASFNSMFFLFQKIVGFNVFPLGIYFLFYSDFITAILLGDQWGEAAHFIGLYGWTLSFQIVFSYLCSESYRALGRPKLSLLVQVIYLIVFLTIIYLSANQSFRLLYTCRSFMNLVMIVINLIVMYFTIKISPYMMLKKLFPYLSTALLMGTFAYFTKPYSQNILLTSFSCLLSLFVYIGALLLFFPSEKMILTTLLNNIVKKK